MLRAIREIKPRWVVGENVRGLVSWSDGLVFEQVQSDLEVEGYEVFPVLLPAAGVAAPHSRDRIWFIGYCRGNGCERPNVVKKELNRGVQKGMVQGLKPPTSNGLGATSNTDGKRLPVNVCGKQRSIYKTDGARKRSELGRASAKDEQWSGFPAQWPVCIGDDGISGKLDGITFSDWREFTIQGAGNAVVPQLVYRIFQTIEQYECQNT